MSGVKRCIDMHCAFFVCRKYEPVQFYLDIKLVQIKEYMLNVSMYMLGKVENYGQQMLQ